MTPGRRLPSVQLGDKALARLVAEWGGPRAVALAELRPPLRFHST